jgi:hypothetical protein
VIVTLWPAMATVALRAAPGLGATARLTVPFALPDAPPVTLTQVALLAAVHEQPLPAVTTTDSEPPAAARLRVSGATV